MLKLKDEPFLTARELAEKLNCSRSFVYQGVSVGVKVGGGTTRVRLPHLRVGAHLRFDLAEVVRFLRADGENPGSGKGRKGWKD